MGAVSWLAFGLLVGALAQLVLPGPRPGDIVATILIGIAGAFVGGFLGALAGIGGVTGVSIGSILTASAGAVLLLLLYRLMVR